MTISNKTLPVTVALAALLPSAALAHTGAESHGLSSLVLAWLHAAPAGGLVLAGVALAGIFLVRRSRAFRR